MVEISDHRCKFLTMIPSKCPQKHLGKYGLRSLMATGLSSLCLIKDILHSHSGGEKFKKALNSVYSEVATGALAEKVLLTK